LWKLFGKIEFRWGVVSGERRGPIYDLSKEKREETGSSSRPEIFTSQL